MKTHMYLEAVSSPQQVQLQLAANADRYTALGAALRADRDVVLAEAIDGDAGS